MNYADFIEKKSQLDGDHGFDPLWMPDFLFPFQRALVEWSLRKGRAAIFADCGLGKTPMQLVWAQNIHLKTGNPALVVTPLAVSSQTIREANKFGIEASISREGSVTGPITVTNYERLHHFSPDDFAGVVCDESSAIKSFDGVRRAIVTEFMRKSRYRLLSTATAAPNDYIELGTSSEALGYLGYMDMLGRFFKNDQNTSKPIVYRQRGQSFETRYERAKWRFKGHAESHFWRWVCSWARALRRPSDLGHDDADFILPRLHESEHVVEAETLRDGFLFDLPAVGLREERDEMRRTIQERCEKVAAMVNDTGQPAVVWCHLNAESDLLKQLIPDAVEVRGKDEPEAKEAAFIAFGSGEARILITKPKIGAWGLNWQHCAHMTFFPSHSYEQYYQAVRRCWRFGQTRPVQVDIVTTEAGARVQHNLERKAKQADAMFSALVEHMNAATGIRRTRNYPNAVEVPAWLS